MTQQPAPGIAQSEQERIIVQHLTQSFKPKQIRVRLTCKQGNLHVLLEAATPPECLGCVNLVRQVLQSLQLREIQFVRVYGRKLEQKQTVWTKVFSLTSVPRSTADQLPRQTYSQDKPFAEPIHKDKQKRLSRPSVGTQKCQLLLFLLSGLSFLLGSSWDLLRLKNYSFGGLFPAFSQSFQIATSSAVNPSPIPSQPPPTTSPELVSTQTLTIKAVGDMIPGTDYPHSRLPPTQKILFEQVKPYFYGADLLFGNFESTMTDYPNAAKDISRPGVFAFRTPPDYAQLFRNVGFDVVSVANNHSLDFGQKGFEDTITHFTKVGIEAVGQKGEISYLTVKNLPVAFIAFSPYATHNSIHDLDAAKALVQKARNQAEIVVVSFHGGAEGTAALHVKDQTEYFYGENRGNLVKFSRSMIDAGADLILGHGPHVPRAVEVYKDKLIAYSLGNFLGYRSLSTTAQLAYSLILEVEMDQQGNFVRGRIIPVHLDREGIPKIDQHFRSVSLIRQLTERDFPETPVYIERNGEIRLDRGLEPFIQ